MAAKIQDTPTAQPAQKTNCYVFFKMMDGQRIYCMASTSAHTNSRRNGGIFTQADWQEWGKRDGYLREEINHEEMLERSGFTFASGIDWNFGDNDG